MIKGGTVIDGLGAPRYKAGVGIAGRSLLLALVLSALLLAGAGLQPAAAATPQKLKPGDLYVSLGSSIAVRVRDLGPVDIVRAIEQGLRATRGPAFSPPSG